MTSQDTFNFMQSEFTISAGETIKALISDKEFTDVTLALGDGQQIEAHKVILSSCSSFFHDILVKHPHQHPLLYLKGVTYDQLRFILEFVYIGQTVVDEASLNDFFGSSKGLANKWP